MEDWITALKSVQKWETYEVSVTRLPGILFLKKKSFSFSSPLFTLFCCGFELSDSNNDVTHEIIDSF